MLEFLEEMEKRLDDMLSTGLPDTIPRKAIENALDEIAHMDAYFCADERNLIVTTILRHMWDEE